MKPYSKEAQSIATPDSALMTLREGNQRFASNKMRHRDLLKQVAETSNEQYPLAVVLSCIDSRLSPELIFDQGFGHIFSIRIAGSVIDEDVLGSIEFACKLGGSKLIVVLGHTKCGAIYAACDNVQTGNLSTLLNKIQTSIYYEKTVEKDRNSGNAEFVEKVTIIQIRRSVEAVIKRSMVLREMIEKGEIGVIGAYYDVDTAKVDFLEETRVWGDTAKFTVSS